MSASNAGRTNAPQLLRLQEPALPGCLRFWRTWFRNSWLPFFRDWLCADQWFGWLGKINLRVFVSAVTFSHPPESSNTGAGTLLAALQYRGFRSNGSCRMSPCVLTGFSHPVSGAQNSAGGAMQRVPMKFFVCMTIGACGANWCRFSGSASIGEAAFVS